MNSDSTDVDASSSSCMEQLGQLSAETQRLRRDAFLVCEKVSVAKIKIAQKLKAFEIVQTYDIMKNANSKKSNGTPSVSNSIA